MKKKCNQCEQLKELSQFGKDARNKDGCRAYCRACAGNYMKSYYNTTPRGKYLRFKDKAKGRGLEFNITFQEFSTWWQAQNQQCYYCGQILTAPEWKKPKLTDLSIERKDNNKGYILFNIVLACRRCNLMKGSWLSEEQMLEIATKYLRG